jgi:hypothetical protein
MRHAQLRAVLLNMSPALRSLALPLACLAPEFDPVEWVFRKREGQAERVAHPPSLVLVKVPPETEYCAFCWPNVRLVLGTRAETPNGEEHYVEPMVSDPWQLPAVSDEVRADSGEGKLMLRGVTGLLLGAAVALTVATGFPF